MLVKQFKTEKRKSKQFPVTSFFTCLSGIKSRRFLAPRNQIVWFCLTMWFKFCVTFVTVAYIIGYNVVQAQTSISSTQYNLQKIVNDLVNHENRLKSAIAAASVKVDAAISDSKAFSDLLNALKSVKTFLGNVGTINDYGKANITLSCGNIGVISASTRFYIQNCYDINYKAAYNATSLMVQYGNLNNAFLQSEASLTDSQHQKVQAVLTAMFVINDEYNQYEVALVTAIYQYTTITTALTYCKNTICSCPSKLSTTASQTLATVDSTITSVQQSVNTWELQIGNVSRATIAIIASVNPGFKAKSDFVKISTTLDTISTFLSGYLNLNSFDAINQTRNCDDAALKIALIQYKLVQYFKTNIEAATNASFMLAEFGILNSNVNEKSSSLSDSQKKNIQSVVASINTLLEDFRQYSLSMISGWVRLYQILFQAQTANDGSCACTGNGGGSGPTIAPTSAATSA